MLEKAREVGEGDVEAEDLRIRVLGVRPEMRANLYGKMVDFSEHLVEV